MQQPMRYSSQNLAAQNAASSNQVHVHTEINRSENQRTRAGI